MRSIHFYKGFGFIEILIVLVVVTVLALTITKTMKRDLGSGVIGKSSVFIKEEFKRVVESGKGVVGETGLDYFILESSDR